MIDLSILLDYFARLYEAVDKLYPKKLTWENVCEQPLDLGIKHPKWIKAHFPLILIYYKEKSGKLRDSKNIEIMYQNNNNVLTQLVWTADDFGMFYRKLKHKGYTNIVGALVGTEEDRTMEYTSMEKPKKFKNFVEFADLYNPSNIHVKALCEILNKEYPCDSTGQLRMI